MYEDLNSIALWRAVRLAIKLGATSVASCWAAYLCF